MDKELTHVNEGGKANMVDVSSKPLEKRTATARGMIRLQPETVKLVSENGMKKGDVLTVARLAGIQAAKQTSNLIPLCHNILLSKVAVEATLTAEGVEVESTVVCTGQTGVEMEALTAVSVALLTVYDMCKAVDNTMELGTIQLVNKIKEQLG